MKTASLIFSLALLALAAGTNLSASDHTAPAAFGELPVTQIAAKVDANGDKVTAGTSRIHVRLRLGAPSWVLADGSWVYSNYVVRTTAGDAGRPASLLVRFSSDRVVRLAMVDQFTLVALREKPASPAELQFVAAAKASR